MAAHTYIHDKKKNLPILVFSGNTATSDGITARG